MSSISSLYMFTIPLILKTITLLITGNNSNKNQTLFLKYLVFPETRGFKYIFERWTNSSRPVGPDEAVCDKLHYLILSKRRRIVNAKDSRMKGDHMRPVLRAGNSLHRHFTFEQDFKKTERPIWYLFIYLFVYSIISCYFLGSSSLLCVILHLWKRQVCV